MARLWSVGKLIHAIYLAAILFAFFVSVQTSGNDLFGPIQPREHPLYLCNEEFGNTAMYRFPEPLNCESKSLDEKSNLLDITFWMVDVSNSDFWGWECWRILHDRWTETNIFYQTLEEVNSDKREAVSVSTCKSLIKTMKTPEGYKLERLDEGIYGTTNPFPYKYAYLTWRRIKSINYYYRKVPLTVNFGSDVVISNIPTTVDCVYQSESCGLPLGTLIWNKSDVSSCNFVREANTSCIQTSDTLTCPEIMRAVGDLSHVDHCGVTFGFNSQKILFTVDGANALNYPNAIITVTDDAAKILPNKEIKSNRRTRATSNVPAGTLPKYPNIQQVSSQFQYLSNLVVKGQEEILRLLQLEVCNINRINLELTRSLMEAGFYSLAVRSLLHDPKYRAYANFDTLSVYQCTEVFNYSFTLTAPNKCINEIPVIFQIGNENFSGYVSGMNHQITNTFTNARCSEINLFFNYGEKSLLISSNKTQNVDVKTLPSFHPVSTNVTFPKFKFAPDPKTGTDYRKMSNFASIAHVQQEIRSRIRVDEIVKTSAGGDDLDEEQSNILDKLTNLMFAPYLKYFSWFLNAAKAILFVVIIGFVLFLLKKIWPCIRIIVFPIRSVIRSFMSSSTRTSNIPLQDRNDRYQRYYRREDNRFRPEI